MTDAAVFTLVSGVITITTMVVGFLTLWVKLRYGDKKTDDAALSAKMVENKIDNHTATMNSVDAKADTIVEQTNGALDKIRLMVSQTSERVSKLEDYNRDSSHRMLDAISALSLKVEHILAVQDQRLPAPPAT